MTGKNFVDDKVPWVREGGGEGRRVSKDDSTFSD